jgi:hypothetical protein
MATKSAKNATAREVPVPASATQLRVCLTLTNLQRQFAAWMSSPVPARGYVSMEGSHSLLVEVAPGMAIQRIIDTALRSEPDLVPGMLAVERQFGVMELHADDLSLLERGKQAMLKGLGAKESEVLPPQILYSDIIDDITDQHAVLINRARQANMIMPGQSLLIMEVAPALYGAVMGNESEKAVPQNTLVECSMIGASGRMYLAGERKDLEVAKAAVEAALRKLGAA